MSKLIKQVNGEYVMTIPAVLLICAYEPTPKSLAAITKFLALAKKNGWGGSTDTAETILITEGASTAEFSHRAADLAHEIGKFITAADVQEVLRG